MVASFNMDKEESQRLREAMKTACEEDDFEKVFELIKAGQDPRHAVSEKKRKPLHYAAFHGNLEVVRTLVEEYGCNPQSRDDNSYTPLHYACYGGHKDVVKYLVTQQKCNPCVKGHKGNLPIHFTCIHEVPATHTVHLFGGYSSMRCKEPTSGPGHYEVAKFLLTEGGCNVTGSKKHALPLIVHLACRYGAVEFVQFLIEQQNCCPNNKNKDKDTPVHLASKYGHVEILRYLVEVQHCSLMQQNRDGNRPLHLACMFQHFEIVQYLVGKQQDLTMAANHKKELPTHTACCEDSLEIVKLVTFLSNVKAKSHNGATPLHVASVHGSLQVVKWLIEEMHCDPNIEDDDSLMPLNYACGHGHRYYYGYLYHNEESVQDKNILVAEYLVANCGCDPMKIRGSISPMKIACKAGNLKLVKALTCMNVNCIDRNGDTPLHLACREKQLKIVRFLTQLEKHFSQKLQNKKGELPLHIACSHGSLELVKLVSDCDVNASTMNEEDSPVHIACRHSQIETVAYLTQERHCDLNKMNSEGELPLHITCERSCLELVKLVSNCDIHAQTESDCTPMHIACKTNATEIVEYLVQEKQCEPSQHPQLYDDLLIHCACGNGNAELVRKLATPTNVNKERPDSCRHIYSSCNDEIGNTPLHEACRSANVEVVKVLVEEFQCDQNIQNHKGELPLHIACSGGSLKMVELVSNCIVNCQTKYERKTPLHIACENEALEVVRYLIQGKDCDVTLVNDEGEMPLHIACSKLSLEMVQLVTNNSVVNSITNYDGNTPLHIACMHGQVEFVRYLTEQYMCDPTLQNRSKELPLHYACQHSLEMVELVSDCDPESKTSDGVTPLHIACLHWKLDIVRYLIENKRCSPDAETSDGLTLLDYACGKTRYHYEFSSNTSDLEQVDEATEAKTAVVKYLMNECDYDPANVLSLFVKACQENNLKIAKLLCTNTDIANSSDAEGNTPLHIACMYKCLELVKFLTEERKCNHSVSNQAGKYPLHIACEHGSLEIVKLVSNCDINTQTTLGDTPLHMACKHEETSLEIMEFLIKQKRCDQIIQNKDGELPLHIACGQRSLEAVKLFSKCDFNAKNKLGNTPLHIACRHNKVEVVRFLTEEWGCDQTIQNTDGELPLHIACTQRSLEVVKLVSDCEVNIQTVKKQTPLHIACGYLQQIDIAHFLVHSKGADPSILDGSGQNYLHEACTSGNLPLVKILAASTTVNSRDKNGNTPLHIACKKRRLDIAKCLIEEAPTQTNTNIQNHYGNLALHIACEKHSLALVKLVGNCTGDPNVKNYAGNTPLHVACMRRDDRCVKYLVKEKGCDVSVQNNNGELPLHIAADTWSIKTVKLVGHCKVNSRTSSGDTPLHIACREGNSKIVQHLVEELNCDPNIQNKNEELPLHIASLQASLRIVELVSNCDPNTKTLSGDTALHLACHTANSRKIAYLLEQKGCNADIQNANGETPLHISCHNHNLQAIKLIGEFVHNPNLVTSCGDTPLHVAFKNIKRLSLSANIIKYLTTTVNCNQSVPNSEGQLPLHLACKWSLEFVKLVSNCNINSQTVEGNTPLHIACKENKMDIVKYLTETKKCDANIQNQKGELPLHIACAKGDLEMAKLVCKCNMNAVTTTGDTPLHLALSSYRENHKLVKFLVSKRRCNFNIQNDKGKLPLHIACEKHSTEIVRLVGNCDVNARTKSGDTPLHTVCRRNTYYGDNFVVEIVKYLVRERHCNLAIQNSDKQLPLHIACEECSMEVIRLTGECDVNIRTKSGDTPLHIICRRNHYMYYSQNTVEEFVGYFVKERHCDLTIQNNDKELPLHIACQNCSLDVVKLVSECNVELQTVSGDTPLHIACRRGDPDTVEYLIKVRHCNPTLHNSDGELPLHIACKKHCKLELVKLLCVFDIDVNIQTLHSGDTPLHYACRYEYHVEEVVKYLVEEKSGNPSIQNNNGQLPLHIACSSRNISLRLVELLSDYGVDFNCRTLTGDTPLHEACKLDAYHSDSKKQVVQFLVEKKHCDPNCWNNDEMTPLHYICNLNERETVLYLLSTGKVGLSVTTKNSDGQTPIMCTNDIEIVRGLLKHGADPHPLYERYEEFFKECSSETPPPTPFNVLVLGNASTGKTTLIESLKAEGKLVVQDTHPNAPTAGIIPNSFESKEYGLVTFYDFAGQHEYYAGHEAVIRTLLRSTPPAIILLVNISESEENIKQKILYWLSFISNQFPTVTTQPHLIIAGSHADIVAEQGANPHEKMVTITDSIKTELAKSTAKFAAFTTVDCRVSISPGLSSLRQQLQKSSKELKDHGVMNFMSHCFHIYLLEYFQHLPAVSLSQITSCLLQKQSNYPSFSSYYPHQRETVIEDSKPKRLLPTKPSEIDSILEELSEKGHILFLKSSRRRFSWVILNKEALLGDINGTVFAPKRFKQYKRLASSTGVVLFSTIARHFPKHDPNMIASFLSHLEFCHVIADEKVLNLIGDKPSNPTNKSASSEPYFLFPHLVTIDHPQNIWRVDDSSEYNCGWVLWCSEDHHFFTPRFLQVILLRLAFSFALDTRKHKDHTHNRDHPAIQRRCSIWKNGISWSNDDGIDVLVEMREQNQVIAVMMRCDEELETRIECVHLRSLLVQKILRMKEEFCSKVSTKEAFINPNELQYPLKYLKDLTLFCLSDVARSVINKKRFVICTDDHCRLKLENLLLFEPYADLGENILKELFDEEKKDTKDKEVTDEFLNHIANEMVRKKDSKYIDYKKECFQQLFDPLPASLYKGASKDPIDQLVLIFQHWRDRSKDRSFGGLRKELDEYSVFCGRNPLVRFSQS